jgi:hypothetical protein
MNTALEYSTRVVQEGDRRCTKSTLKDLAYLTPLRIPLMNPVTVSSLGKYVLCGPALNTRREAEIQTKILRVFLLAQ